MGLINAFARRVPRARKDAPTNPKAYVCTSPTLARGGPSKGVSNYGQARVHSSDKVAGGLTWWGGRLYLPDTPAAGCDVRGRAWAGRGWG